MSLVYNQYQHKRFLAMKGFLNNIDYREFPREFIDILYKYGHWMNALYLKQISPTTKAQEKFIETCTTLLDANTQFELAFIYYVKHMKKLALQLEAQEEQRRIDELAELEDLRKFRDYINQCSTEELEELFRSPILSTKKNELLRNTLARINWKAPEPPDAYGGMYSVTDGQ